MHTHKPSASSDHTVALEDGRCERPNTLHSHHSADKGRVYLDLSHVCVAAILVVGEDGDLNHVGADGSFLDVLKGYEQPSSRLVQIHNFNLL